MLQIHHRDAGGDIASLAAACAVAALAAVALEAAFAPAVMLGAAAALAPRRLARLRRRQRAPAPALARAPSVSIGSTPDSVETGQAPQFSFAGLKFGRSAMKTVTFRVIASGLDFGWNYFLLGEVATAAGLSAVSLGAAPLFYFLHETAWNHFRSDQRASARIEATGTQVPVTRAMAKTITYRTFATISEFGTNFAVVRDVGLAAELSAFGFFAGPFVYLAHEKAWDYYGKAKPEAGAAPPPAPRLLTAP
ncbi:DUF2061 domain-containing protein [Methylocystis heyeri]|uniref:DUF2061 domain-containing protein n=1 Tax=Methylocystis heyeri TaxID=391905 RepID=A0A6B8K8G9_9HYPH|nr:DUF2061 domain-containing protein [Methylocystis heyeri]QGM44306.1 DUF2061 domain-containing protein [Methylocystis heyeri]